MLRFPSVLASMNSAVTIGTSFVVRSSRHRHAIFMSTFLVSCVCLAALAFGWLGNLNQSCCSPTSVSVVVGAIRHAFLGLALSLAMWLLGTGLARLIPKVAAEPLASAALLGFMLSLPLTAAFAALCLVLPAVGPWLVATGALASCVTYLTRPLPKHELLRTARLAVELTPSAVLFGTWLGILLHGPSATENGAPFGDLTFYSGQIWSLAAYPTTLTNLGVLGETQGAFNMLWPAIGASLPHSIDLDPFFL